MGFRSLGGAVGSCQDGSCTCAAEQEEATGISSKCRVVQQLSPGPRFALA